jgi:hypothetical protein
MANWQRELQAWRAEFEQERRRQREAVIAEFTAGDPDANATLDALAVEILRYREAIAQLAKAIGRAQARGAVRDDPSRPKLAVEAAVRRSGGSNRSAWRASQLTFRARVIRPAVRWRSC